jgi:hypothetical protein
MTDHWLLSCPPIITPNNREARMNADGAAARSRPWIRWAVFGFGLAVCLGCSGGGSSQLPSTYKVTGTVVFKGGKPVTGGAIQFSPVSDTSFTVSGDVADDGSFTLSTVKGAERVSGAPEGEYRVTVLLPLPADQKAIPGITLPKNYRVEPKDNTFTIEITPPSRP